MFCMGSLYPDDDRIWKFLVCLSTLFFSFVWSDPITCKSNSTAGTSEQEPGGKNSVRECFLLVGLDVSPCGPCTHPAHPRQGKLQQVLSSVSCHALGSLHVLPGRWGITWRHTWGGCPRMAGMRGHCFPSPCLLQAPQPCAGCFTCSRGSATSRDKCALCNSYCSPLQHSHLSLCFSPKAFSYSSRVFIHICVKAIISFILWLIFSDETSVFEMSTLLQYLEGLAWVQLEVKQ